MGQRVASRARPYGGVVRAVMQGGLADLAHLKMQVPLPETAKELCDVAHAVRAETRDIILGRRQPRAR